jgi:hypothetical protein
MFPHPQQHIENDDEHTVAAMAVLQHRLEGESHRSAVSRVSMSHALSTVEVDQSWASRKRDALTELTIGRVVDACPWTEAEMARLLQIFSGEPWFAPPVHFE